MNTNLRLFIAYRIFSRMYFHLPILFLLFWSLQITYVMATILLAAYSAASTIASDFAPRLSRVMPVSNVVVLGECMKALGLVLLVFGTMPGDSSILPLLLGQLIGGAGFSLALSADGSLLRQVASDTDTKALGALQAKAQSWMFIATLLAGFMGGILFDHQPHWALYAGIAATLMAIAMIITIVRNLWISNGGATEKPLEKKQSSGGVAPLELTRTQSIWIGFYSITRAFALAPFIGLLPLHFALQRVDPYLFGLVLGLFTLGGFLVALYGGPILAKLGLKGTLVSFGGIVVSLTVFAASDVLDSMGMSYFVSSLIGISVLGIAAGAIRPSVMSCLDVSNLSAMHKMSVFSRMERVFGYLCATLLVLFGVLVENFSITATFGISVLALFLTLIAGWVWLNITYPERDQEQSASA